jgi:SAM-dependent methyltransferase
MKAKDHYEHHLGNFYSWMIGDFEEKQLEQEKFFFENGILPTSSKSAFDLGAGHGLQAIALAKLGFAVKAIDFNKQLLEELDSRKRDLNIKIIEDDFSNFLKRTHEQAEVIVCMGDTLTHLESLDHVKKLIREVAKHLEPRGKIVFSFRDLTKELKNEERFIPVKNDDTRIPTCFLEYFSDRVLIHDILYEKQNGQWLQKVSFYPKLCLNEAMIVDLFEKNNIELIKSDTINRMIHLIGRKRIV